MLGQLPQVAFIDPIFVGTSNTENDEHPTANIQVGEQFVQQVVNAVMTSPQWPSSALFLTYDEHGGFYDHVKPPAACEPDDIPPLLASGDVQAAFDRYGFRVPFVAVSPFSKAGYVSHKVYDHTSILRFIETRFDLPALTRRDANARPMLELFDFENPPFLTPPSLPDAPLDQAHFQEDQCVNGTGSGGL
jgi:phospholipase C